MMRPSGFILLLAGALTPTLAAAQSAEDALLNECYTLRRAGRHDASLPRCEEAAARFPSGRSLAQLALTEMALSRWVAAATHFTAALADADHPSVRQNRASIDEALNMIRAHVGALEVTTNVPDATLSLGAGPRVAVTRVAFALPGPVTLTVRAADGRTLTRDVTLNAGQLTRERVDFAAAPSTVAARGMPPAGIIAPPATTPPPPSISTRRVLAFTAGGVALAGFGLALVSWRQREAAVAVYLDLRCPTGDTSDAERTRCVGPHNTARKGESLWEAVTAVGLVAGGVFAVTSAILFATEPSRREPRTTWACAPSLGHPGGSCTVSF